MSKPVSNDAGNVLIDYSGTTLFPSLATPPPPPCNSPLHDSLPSFQYLPIDKVPNRETAARIKQTVLRLLDGFTHDAPQPARKEGYIKIATMLKYIADSRTFLMACIVVASTDTDYNYKLGWSPSLPFLMPFTYLCSTLQLIFSLPLTSSSRRPLYLRVKEIASTVDESFFKPQEEFFLCQQLFNATNCRPSKEVLVIQPRQQGNKGAMSEMDNTNQHE